MEEEEEEEEEEGLRRVGWGSARRRPEEAEIAAGATSQPTDQW